MNNRRNTTLQMRLAGISILGLFIALAATAFYNGRQVKHDSNMIAQDAVPGTINAHYMRMAISRSLRGVLMAASVQTPASRNASLKVTHEADVAFADSLKQYLGSIKLNEKEDMALVETLKSRYQEFRKHRMAYEALVLAGRRDESAAYLERELAPSYQPVLQAADDLLHYNHSHSIDFAGSITSSIRQLDIIVVVVLLLALICMAVLIVNYFFRRQELQELQEKEEKFSKAFQTNPSGIVITDFDTGRCLEVNDSFCRLLGRTPEELIDSTTVEVGIWPSEEERQRILQPLINGESVRDLERQVSTREGTTKTVSINVEIIELAKRKCCVALVEDITEKKQAGLRIRHLNRVYAVLSAINKNIVREQDEDTMLAETCRIAVEVGGFRMAWIGMHDAEVHKLLPVASAGVVQGYLDLVNIDLRDQERSNGPSGRCFLSGHHVTCSDMANDPMMQPWREEALKRGYRSSGCFPLKIGDSTIGTFTLYADQPGFFDEEEVRLLDELALDISFALDVGRNEARRRKAEQELRWRTAFFEAQVRTSIDGILVVDSEGRKVLQNERVNQLWKIPPHIASDPDDTEQFQWVLSQVKEPQAFAAKAAHLYAHPDESSSDLIELLDGTVLERYSAPVRGSDGTYYGRVWTFHDITQRRKLEQQFLRAQRMESIGTLASGLAHDLNNILAPIMMSVDLLRLGVPEEKRLRLLDAIESSAERGTKIIRQVLTFGRGMEGEKQPVEAGRLIHEIEKIILSTFPKNIIVETRIEPGLRTVTGDATQLHQMLLNLCVNARDAMPDGGWLRLEASNLDLDASFTSILPESVPGPYMLLEVSDTGTGIPPDLLDHIFDPFFTTKEVGKGTGLGLSTVHGIVKGHGGFIKVQSMPGKGTTFRIYLPVAPDQEAAADIVPTLPSPEGRGESVLVVDDEPQILRAAQDLLETHGYKVITASDGAEALAIFTQKSSQIAAVLTDAMMPIMNGPAFLRCLRKAGHKTPAIISTGQSDKVNPAEMEELGVQKVLLKPYNSGALLRTLHNVLHSGQPEA